MLSNPQKPYRREAGVRFLRVPQEGRRASCVTAQFHNSTEAKTGAPEYRPPALTFCAHLYAFRTSFLRVQVKSYCPLCDRRLEALKIGRWISPKCVGWWADLRGIYIEMASLFSRGIGISDKTAEPIQNFGITLLFCQSRV